MDSIRNDVDIDTGSGGQHQTTFRNLHMPSDEADDRVAERAVVFYAA